MEPRLPIPIHSPETGGNERGLEVVNPSERTALPASAEIGEKAQPIEFARQASIQDASAAVRAVQFPVPVVNQPTQSVKATSEPIVGSNPLAARDDDLIEREWIERAKRIIEDTRDDPRKQGDEVSRLQADYLNKRYGKNLIIGGQ